MATLRDFYEILGVQKDADSETIKKAYRKLAMQFHPDRNPGNKESEEKFKEAASAYEVLSDSNKRAQYDRFGHQAFAGSGGPQYQNMDDIFSSFGDLFSDFFGGAQGAGRDSRRSGGARRGADLRYISEVDLEDVLKGLEKEIEFTTEKSCEPCNGSGAEKGSQPEVCSTCNGAGQVVARQGFFSMATTCPNCQGQGRVVKNKCKSCKGSGRSKVDRKIRVNIPAGVDTGTRLRVNQEGEGGYRGGPAGDLYVEIRVKDHEIFEREEDHLFSKVQVHYTEALLGAKLEVPTLDGKAELVIPSCTQPGVVLSLKGQGLPSLRGGRRGDIHFECVIEFPKKLSDKEIALLTQLSEISKDSKKSEKSGFWSKKKS